MIFFTAVERRIPCSSVDYTATKSTLARSNVSCISIVTSDYKMRKEIRFHTYRKNAFLPLRRKQTMDLDRRGCSTFTEGAILLHEWNSSWLGLGTVLLSLRLSRRIHFIKRAEVSTYIKCVKMSNLKLDIDRSHCFLQNRRFISFVAHRTFYIYLYLLSKASFCYWIRTQNDAEELN